MQGEVAGVGCTALPMQPLLTAGQPAQRSASNQVEVMHTPLQCTIVPPRGLRTDVMGTTGEAGAEAEAEAGAEAEAAAEAGAEVEAKVGVEAEAGAEAGVVAEAEVGVEVHRIHAGRATIPAQAQEGRVIDIQAHTAAAPAQALLRRRLSASRRWSMNQTRLGAEKWRSRRHS